MKRLALILLATMLVWSTTPIAAQDDIDIPAVGEQVASVDPERLLMRLNTPIPDDLLPPPFSAAAPLTADLLTEQRTRFVETLEDLRGSAIYTVEYAPAAVVASPQPSAATSPMASPMARGPKTAFTSGTLTYLLFNAPVELADIGALGDDIQAALGTDALAGTVEQITVNDAPALLVSTVTVVNALEFHTEWIAIPVGNVVVVAMVTEGSDTFDQARFRADNQALAVSGVAYLQRIVEEMGAA